MAPGIKSSREQVEFMFRLPYSISAFGCWPRYHTDYFNAKFLGPIEYSIKNWIFLVKIEAFMPFSGHK